MAQDRFDYAARALAGLCAIVPFIDQQQAPIQDEMVTVAQQIGEKMKAAEPTP